MSRTRPFLFGSPLLLAGLLGAVLGGAWWLRELIRQGDPGEMLRPESAIWHAEYEDWVQEGRTAWPRIHETLRGDSGPGRRIALLAVGALRDAPPDVRDAVQDLLEADDPADRREALVAWTAVDRDPLHSLDELATACADDNSIVRGTAIEMLFCIGREAIPVLEPIVAKPGHPAQTAALQALLLMGADSASLVDLSRRVWNDTSLDLDLRRLALSLLVAQRAASLDELATGARTDNPVIQSIALWGIREAGPQAGKLVPELLTLPLPPKMRIPQEQSLDGQIVRFPVQAYVSMPMMLEDVDASQSIPQMSFDDDQRPERLYGFTLLSVLGDIGSSETISLDRFHQELPNLDPPDRVTAAQTLLKLGWSTDDCAAMLERLYLKGGTGLKPAAELLRSIDPERARRVAETLRQQLAEPEGQERQAIIERLGYLGSSSAGAIDDVAARLKSGDLDEQLAVLQALAAWPAQSARYLEDLLDLAEGPSEPLANRALKTIGQLREHARPVLDRLVKLAVIPGAVAADTSRLSVTVTMPQMVARPGDATATVAREDPFVGPAVPRQQTALEAVALVNQSDPRPIPEISRLLRRNGEDSALRACAFDIESAATKGSSDRLALAQEVFGWGDELLQRRVLDWLGQHLSDDPDCVAQLLTWLTQSLSQPLVRLPANVGLSSVATEQTDPEVRQRLLLLERLQSVANDEAVKGIVQKCREEFRLIPTADERQGRQAATLRELLRQRRDQLQALDQLVTGRRPGS